MVKPRMLATLATISSLCGAAAFAQLPPTEDEFEVGVGYLSSAARKLVEQHGWSLVWKAKEDRLVEFPFSVRLPAGDQEDALRGALNNLLDAYQGQFVADMYRANRVVAIDIAPPNPPAVRPIALELNEADTEGDEANADVSAAEQNADAGANPATAAGATPGG